ncbi:MAG: cell division ATP-binding protein FtsE [Candidatus Pacebacteria bacterium]|nr:cell division ATP-binding protein FtsE [Candidatus Paceibacterota bacterium]
MITFQNVEKLYPPNTIALEDVSFKIKKGEFLLLAGRSGTGKTTLLKLILAQEHPTKGRVFFSGQDVHKIKKQELPYLRRKIGAVFQDYKLLTSKTIFENIAFIMEVMGSNNEEIQLNVPKVLEIVGLENKMQNFPKELSSGQLQRAAIARALIHRPLVILADEPTGNLDPHNTSEIIGLLQKINEFGTTVILATHNRDVIKKLKKRTIVLENGKIVRDDEKGELVL